MDELRKYKKADDDKDVLLDFTREDENAQGKSELRRKKALNIITNDERPDYEDAASVAWWVHHPSKWVNGDESGSLISGISLPSFFLLRYSIAFYVSTDSSFKTKS